MRYLTLDKIKAQCRIEEDFTLEDDLLEGYGESAEDTVLNLLNRSYEDLIESYGKVPAAIMQATMMLVAGSYQNREAYSAQNLSAAPYGFEMLIKPYMRLTINEKLNTEENGCKNL